MENFNPAALRQAARTRLGECQNPRRLIWIYSGVLLILSLAVNGLTLYLDTQIEGTGGLGGVGMRSMLETAQTMLSYFTMIFTPLWSAGILSCVIAMVRSADATPRNYKGGFKLRVLTLSILEVCIAFCIAMVTMYLAVYLFMMTPMADPFTELIESGALVDSNGVLNYAAMTDQVLLQSVLPMLLIFVALYVPVYVFYSYAARMALYLLVGEGTMGAMTAIFASFRLMKGYKWKLFRLDLSFWWYYALNALVTVVAYLDVVLPILGIQLPIGSTAAYFVALALSLVCQLALNLWKKLEVDTAYVLAYESIAHPREPEVTVE